MTIHIEALEADSRSSYIVWCKTCTGNAGQSPLRIFETVWSNPDREEAATRAAGIHDKKTEGNCDIFLFSKAAQTSQINPQGVR